MKEIHINTFAPRKPHAAQKQVLDVLDKGQRFVMIRAGRKWAKTSLMISWLFEKALETGLVCTYIAPSRKQAKDIVWTDHIQRMINELKRNKIPYKPNETELSITLPNGGKVQLHGVENKDALRGISNWGAVACFTGDTNVLTSKGYVKISDISKGDDVVTPNGLRKVLKSGKVKDTDQIVEVRLSDGTIIKCTPDHKFFTDNGLVRADELCYNTVICTTNRYPLNLKEQFTGYRKAYVRGISGQGLEEKQGIFTTQYGKISMEKYRKDLLFITWTETSSITILKILNVLQVQNILKYISKIGLRIIQKPFRIGWRGIYPSYWTIPEVKKEGKLPEGTLKKQLKRLLSGIIQMKERSGTQKEEKRIGKIGNTLKRFVRSAVRRIFQPTQNVLDIAPHVVEIKNLSVKDVPVYNLEVDTDHCYFANGALVSNCDEYDDWEEDIYPTIIRPNLITHSAPVIIAGTPKGFRNLYKIEKNPDFKCFHFRTHDNPDIKPDELKSIEREYSDMGMGYYRQEILAVYEKPYGIVYEEWPLENFVSCPYDPALPLYMSFDFGVNDPTAIVWVQRLGGEYHLIDYYEASDADPAHFSQVIKSKPYKTAELVCGDPAGKARSITTNTSPIEEYRKLGIYIRVKDGVKIPEQIRTTHKYIKSLYVDVMQERFRELILNYRYPKKSEALINQSNEIPVHDQFSHGMRALEYLFVNLDVYTPPQISYKSIPKFEPGDSTIGI